MTENPNDPAGSTHEFRAFANRGQQEQPAKSGPSTGVIAGIVALAVLVVLAVIVVAVVV